MCCAAKANSPIPNQNKPLPIICFVPKQNELYIIAAIENPYTINVVRLTMYLIGLYLSDIDSSESIHTIIRKVDIDSAIDSTKLFLLNFILLF